MGAFTSGAVFVVDGVEHTIRASDLGPKDLADFAAVTGTDLADLATILEDPFTLAAFLWIHRRRTEPGLTVDDVAGEITFGTRLEVRPLPPARPRKSRRRSPTFTKKQS